MKPYDELRASALRTLCPPVLNIGKRDVGWSCGAPPRDLPADPWECAATLYASEDPMSSMDVRAVAKLLRRRGVTRAYKVARVAWRLYVRSLPGWADAARRRAENRRADRRQAFFDACARTLGWREPRELLADRLHEARRRGGVIALRDERDAARAEGWGDEMYFEPTLRMHLYELGVAV